MPARRRKRLPLGSAEANRPRSTRRDGFIAGCRRDSQTVTAEWVRVQEPIEGVRVREVRNVVKGNGLLTEVYRRDWGLDRGSVGQVFQVRLGIGEISAWHAHFEIRDRLFVNQGLVRIVLYDARRSSSSFGRINELRLGLERPALVVVPTGVWHGLQNLSVQPSSVLNIVDGAYSYENPDHWRLPADSPKIPYRFPKPPGLG